MKAEEAKITCKLSAAGPVPSSWKVLRAKVLYRERKERSESGEEELLSASHKTGITPRSEKDVGMFLAESLEGYKMVYPGDAVVNTMWAWMGALGVSTVDGVISPSYGVYAPTSIQRHSRYFDYLFRSKPFVAEINRFSKGIWSSRLRLYPIDFLNLNLPYPPLDVQERVAEFLDSETHRIDQLIAKKRELLTLAGLRIEALVDRAISDPTIPHVRFENLVDSIKRSVVLSGDAQLVRLGLYNRGRGIFKKPAVHEQEKGESDFFHVKAGDLILSGQFAWEGAVALATSHEDGCVVSHRYPIYRGKSAVSSSYLLGFLRSGYGVFLLNESSRGAAGRNRPLNTWRLGKEKIPVPNKDLQSAIERAVNFERSLRDQIDRSISHLGELRSSLIARAVTGELESASWRKQHTDDPRPDQIEEAMNA